MKYIVLDLEATCWRKDKGLRTEIIEIEAVCVNDTAQIIGVFNTFVQPKLYPVLSDFCTELTTITQNNVTNAPLFPIAYQQFLSWIEGFKDNYVLCSWGFYDKNQLIKECKLHQLDTAWLIPHISVKHQYAVIKALKRPIGMKGALELEKLSLEGLHHRGIDDARNIKKIFLAHFHKWRMPV